MFSYVSLALEFNFVINFGLFPTENMEQKPDCLSTKWTRSLQGIPPFTHELLEQHLIGETAQESKQEGKQPKGP